MIMKNMKSIVSRVICIFLSALILMAAGCKGSEETSDPTLESNEPDKKPELVHTEPDPYYLEWPDILTYQAYAVDLSDGGITAACPDPLCSHGETDEKCPFYGYITQRAAASGGYIYYHLFGSGDLNEAICVYNIADKKTELVYKYTSSASVSDTSVFLSGDGKLLFNVPETKMVHGALITVSDSTIMRYDPVTKEVSEFGTAPDGAWLKAYANGYLVYSYEGKPYRTKNGFDDPEEILLPDGTDGNGLGYYADLTPGLMFRSKYPARIYLYEYDKFIDPPTLPEGTGIYSPKMNGDYIYYSTSSYGYVPDENGKYHLTLFITNRLTNETETYSVESEYNFNIMAGYERKIFADINFKCVDGKQTDSGFRENRIWIDLETGKTVLYDDRAENVRDLICGETSVGVTRSGG